MSSVTYRNKGKNNTKVKNIKGGICHQGKGRAGRPSVNEETIERVRDSFIRSPKKSVRRASQQLQIPKSTVWKIARKRLQIHPLSHPLVKGENLELPC
ncbi:hypothetical protein C0J52_16201 [Blattella germanica]|nr:hypothetical protein C0J52_16201 [Blattella germanica]